MSSKKKKEKKEEKKSNQHTKCRHLDAPEQRRTRRGLHPNFSFFLGLRYLLFPSHLLSFSFSTASPRFRVNRPDLESNRPPNRKKRRICCFCIFHFGFPIGNAHTRTKKKEKKHDAIAMGALMKIGRNESTAGEKKRTTTTARAGPDTPAQRMQMRDRVVVVVVVVVAAAAVAVYEYSSASLLAHTAHNGRRRVNTSRQTR